MKTFLSSNLTWSGGYYSRVSCPLHTPVLDSLFPVLSHPDKATAAGVERRMFSGWFLLSIVWETVFTGSPCRLDLRLGPTMIIRSYFPLLLTVLQSWQVQSTRATSMTSLHEKNLAPCLDNNLWLFPLALSMWRWWLGSLSYRFGRADNHLRREPTQVG